MSIIPALLTRKVLLQKSYDSECMREEPIQLHLDQFPKRKGWLLSTAHFLRFRVPPCGSFTYCSDERSRGNARECAPCRSRQLSALFVEKTVMVSIQTLGSLLHMEGYPLLLRGQVKAHSSEMCDLPHTMGKMRIVLIWYRSTPI